MDRLRTTRQNQADEDAGPYPARLQETSMTEEEFDSFMANRPFRFEDLRQVEADAGRFTSLALALWGRTPTDLASRLDAPDPQLPPGCTLADLRQLQRYVQRLSAEARKPNNAWLTPLTFSSLGMIAGSPHVSEGLDARLELLRRAIKYLENK